MSFLASAIEKLERRTKAKEDRQEEESLREGEKDKQFREELEDAVRELKRFTRSDEYEDALTLLKTIEDYNEIKGNSIGEEIANKLLEEANRLESELEAIRKEPDGWVEGSNGFLTNCKFDAIQKKMWSLQEQSGRARQITHKIKICSKEGPVCNTISYYLAPDGFVLEGEKAKPEEIVKYFSRIDYEEDWPSKLLPMIREKISITIELLELP